MTEYVSYENVVSAEYTGNDYFKGYTPKNLGFNWPTRHILTVNYYDNYEFLKLNKFKTLELGYTADANYGTRHGSDTNLVSAKGFLQEQYRPYLMVRDYLYCILL